MLALMGWGIREGKKDRITKRYEELMGVKDLITVWMVVAVSWVVTYIHSYQTVHFKHVQFIFHQLYFNKAVIKSKY